MNPRQLEAAIRAGHLDPNGRGLKVQAHLCRKCQRATLQGYDPLMLAIVDPQPQDIWGELRAVMDGLRTYDLRWVSGRYELDHRESERIAGAPPGSQAWGVGDVVVAHKCGRENYAGRPSIAEKVMSVSNRPKDPPF